MNETISIVAHSYIQIKKKRVRLHALSIESRNTEISHNKKPEVTFFKQSKKGFQNSKSYLKMTMKSLKTLYQNTRKRPQKNVHPYLLYYTKQNKNARKKWNLKSDSIHYTLSHVIKCSSYASQATQLLSVLLSHEYNYIIPKP